jgi:hypothetical protein
MHEFEACLWFSHLKEVIQLDDIGRLEMLDLVLTAESR